MSRVLIAAALLLATTAPAGWGQTRPVDGLSADRATLEQRANDLTKRLTAADELPESVRAQLERQLTLLGQIGHLFEQQAVERDHLGEVEAQLAEVVTERSRKALPQNGAAAPSLIELDTTYEELTAQRARALDARTAVEVAVAAVDNARRELSVADRARAKLAATLEEVRQSAEQAAVAEELEAAVLEQRLRAETVTLQQARLETLRKVSELRQARTRLQEEQFAKLKLRVVFTTKQLEELQRKLDEDTEALIAQAAGTDAELTVAERAWSEARRKLNATPDPGPAVVQQERMHRHAVELKRLRLRLTHDRRARIGDAKLAWERRHALMAVADDERRHAWRLETEQKLEQLSGQYIVATAELAALRQRREAAQATVTELEASGDTPRTTLRAARSVRATLDELVGMIEQEQVGLDNTRALLDRLLNDIAAGADDESWFSRAWAQVVRMTGTAWEFELASVNDRSITVSGVAKGLLLLVVGLLVARLATRLFRDLLMSRLRLDEGAAATLESLSFYLCALLIALMALKIGNIPLTAFTILGGALAIGIGFGTQTIMSNFISGLIMLVERPVRVGDLVEVRGSTQGIIRRIGPRATQVQTGEGVDILLPNSSFLEAEVVNWTLSDNKVRTCVKVGVAYGSPTRETARLLRRAAEEHGRILEKPEPFVLFSDFGDNALQFELYFWTHVRRPMDARRIQSDIRFIIDGLFREASIVIAFPQRDVHIDGLGPVELHVKSLPDAEPAPSDETPSDETT